MYVLLNIPWSPEVIQFFFPGELPKEQEEEGSMSTL